MYNNIYQKLFVLSNTANNLMRRLLSPIKQTPCTKRMVVNDETPIKNLKKHTCRVQVQNWNVKRINVKNVVYLIRLNRKSINRSPTFY